MVSTPAGRAGRAESRQPCGPSVSRLTCSYRRGTCWVQGAGQAPRRGLLPNLRRQERPCCWFPQFRRSRLTTSQTPRRPPGVTSRGSVSTLRRRVSAQGPASRQQTVSRVGAGPSHLPCSHPGKARLRAQCLRRASVSWDLIPARVWSLRGRGEAWRSLGTPGRTTVAGGGLRALHQGREETPQSRGIR